ncbi:MAG TPA: helix-turn-helix domain-containing protein [Alphaproteobacteria bacterium]|nr:helix-turn-helix domain-containing protein [Alphaproteobacteria bacterium]
MPDSGILAPAQKRVQLDLGAAASSSDLIRQFVAAAFRSVDEPVAKLKRAGFSGPNISAYKNNGHAPKSSSASLETLIRIAHACELNLHVAVTASNEAGSQSIFEVAFMANTDDRRLCHGAAQIYAGVRELLNVSQQRLAKKQGTEQGVISQRERGYRTRKAPQVWPRIETLRKTALKSGVSISIILRPQMSGPH